MGDWSSAQYVTSQVFVLVAYIFLALTYFVAKRWKQLAITISSNITMGVGFILLGGWVGLAMCVIAICRDVTSSILNARRPPETKTKNTRLDFWLLALWLSALTVATIFTQEGFVTLFAFFATVTFTISIWQKNPLIYRALGVLVGVFWIIYNVALNNLAGLVLESSLLIFVIVGLILFMREMKLDKNKIATKLQN